MPDLDVIIGTMFLLNNDQAQILIPLTPESAHYWSRNTRWDLGQDFDSRQKQAPFVVFIFPDGEKFLLQVHPMNNRPSISFAADHGFYNTVHMLDKTVLFVDAQFQRVGERTISRYWDILGPNLERMLTINPSVIKLFPFAALKDRSHFEALERYPIALTNYDTHGHNVYGPFLQLVVTHAPGLLRHLNHDRIPTSILEEAIYQAPELSNVLDCDDVKTEALLRRLLDDRRLCESAMHAFAGCANEIGTMWEDIIKVYPEYFYLVDDEYKIDGLCIMAISASPLNVFFLPEYIYSPQIIKMSASRLNIELPEYPKSISHFFDMALSQAQELIRDIPPHRRDYLPDIPCIQACKSSLYPQKTYSTSSDEYSKPAYASNLKNQYLFEEDRLHFVALDEAQKTFSRSYEAVQEHYPLISEVPVSIRFKVKNKIDAEFSILRRALWQADFQYVGMIGDIMLWQNHFKEQASVPDQEAILMLFDFMAQLGLDKAAIINAQKS